MKNFKALLTASFLLISTPTFAALERQQATVIEAVSGDTVRLKGGKTLRYASIQAAPLQSLVPEIRNYGQKALDANRSLVEGKTITVEWGSKIRDERGNLLGFVFLEDGTFVNEHLTKEGHAKWRLEPPNLKYSDRLREADLQARRDKKGLWVNEPNNPYLDSRFIGQKDLRIYHHPTCERLSNVAQAHLMTFASRVDAKAADYKPCPYCKNASQEDAF